MLVVVVEKIETAPPSSLKESMLLSENTESAIDMREPSCFEDTLIAPALREKLLFKMETSNGTRPFSEYSTAREKL